ncbi:MAG: tyrosine--tRNA ligase [Candidatus Yanofskybacteria bacterium RIFCSPLOWO2_02_FULL_45_10]|uniref:Tyrosine--tRNA ligase n=2 Tax=Candidatus Yanofskyibacteriota TaxID=1752733 RepID=A0A1F8G0B8_9BACT|nr:MAG: tyrosine--tRNA ligase [Candidatus Yanofskybacteria bacterium RIFCSPHIGHO2_12_FULL_45_19b]OGN31583.1 MAG: tyrosine--tRNA ligase [Candidatus Yanofskybacteria bacterium RIFCSPLOWO2_02_FULL_45_10]
MSEIPTKSQIEELFGRYVDTIFPSLEKAVELLSSGKPLTFYLGIDPTGPDIHLGHTTNLLVLKKLIKLGHKVILLMGDFTAQTGDPTGKDSTRKVLDNEQVLKNMETYLDQVNKILEKDSYVVRHNSEWLAGLTFAEIRKLARHITVQQTITRDMFQKRLAEGKAITLEEFLYPLMQGYDSVAMAVDGEIGGTDQTFNMMMGRDLVGAILGKEKIVITTRLLEDPETKKKIMNKSEGSYVSLNDSANEMFGKAMALSDSAILPILTYCTEVSLEKVNDLAERLKNGENPKVLKEEMAKELVKMYYGPEPAEAAVENFTKVFSKGGLPDDILELANCAGQSIVDLIFNNKLALSRSEAKRLIEQGGVKIDEQTVSDWDQTVKVGEVIKIGARRFVKVVS